MDNTKLNYSSEWDIDQLDNSGEVNNITLPGSTSTLSFVTLQTLSLGYPPVVDGSFQVVGDTVWRQFGDASNVTVLQAPILLTSSPTGIFLAYYNFNLSDVVVNVQWYIWADKINY